MVKTKIISTLGPASSSEQVLRKMMINGLDVVRLNFSHGNHSEHIKRIELINMLNKKMRRSIKIMQDLEGYRLRVGDLKTPIVIKKRTTYHMVQKDSTTNPKEIPFDYRGSLGGIKNGALIYIDDGRIILKVEGKEKGKLKARVISAGIIKSHKGINISDAKLEFEPITAKDRIDVEVAIKYKLDYIAQSFVGSANDIRLLKSIVEPRYKKAKFYAKIENPQALDNIDEIIEEADGIIVARGDLGISVPIYKVPVIQKEIIKKCNLANKPVVVATQMLESMIEEELPTRAEVSDVANAILDGATHLLVSGETAVGIHPDKLVAMMNDIIKNTEGYKRKLKNLFE